jgi:tocopherol O-methyltransferase
MTPPPTLTDDIREHYDRLSPLYQTFWGDHIHHGYWLQDEPAAQAQENLIRQLAADAAIAPGSRVADLGCGVGGSACWLARKRNCSVLGITISPVQARMASTAAAQQGLKNQLHFEVADLNHFDTFTNRQPFDSAWILEASEHIADKRRFLHDVARILKPQGTLGIGAWVAGEAPRTAEQEELLASVCTGMFCPGLGAISEYVAWMQEAGFKVGMVRDLTTNVRKTWKRCAEIAVLPQVEAFLKIAPAPVRQFVGTFPEMMRAYDAGAMRYALMSGILAP